MGRGALVGPDGEAPRERRIVVRAAANSARRSISDSLRKSQLNCVSVVQERVPMPLSGRSAV
jgi:hypothetical protein